MEKYIYSDAIAFIKFYSDTKLLECLVGGVGGNITKDELLKVIDFDCIVKVELVEFDEDTQLHYKMVKYSEIEFTQDLEIFKNENLEYSHKEYYDYLKLTDTVEPTENDKKVVGSTPTNFEKKDSKMKKVNLKNVVITEDNISDYYEFMSDDELLEHSSLISTVFYYRYNDLYKVRIYDNGKHGKYFKLPQRENTKILFSEKFKDNNGYDNYKLSPSTPPILELNDVHLLHDGLSPVGLTIFGVKDTLKPLDDYILEIKESVSYKDYVSSLSVVVDAPATQKNDNTTVDVSTPKKEEDSKMKKDDLKNVVITKDSLDIDLLDLKNKILELNSNKKYIRVKFDYKNLSGFGVYSDTLSFFSGVASIYENRVIFKKTWNSMRYMAQNEFEIHNIKIVKFNKDDLKRCFNSNNDFLIVNAPKTQKNDNTIVDVATISKLLIKEFGITEDTLQLHQLKGYKKAIAFTKEWYHKKEFLTFNSNDDFTEISVNIRSCSVC